MALLQAGAGVASWSLLQIIIAVIVVAGAVGILYVVLNWMGVQIPPPIVRIFWIVLAVVVGIFAIKFIWGMM